MENAGMIDFEEPIQGVVVLSREEFETNLKAGFRSGGDAVAAFPVDDETGLRAAELAGRANRPGCIGMIAFPTRENQRFSGNLFIVADKLTINDDRTIITDFDIVAVDLTGRAGWLATDVRMGMGAAPSGRSPASQPGRCCGPSTICVPAPAPDTDPLFRFGPSSRIAIMETEGSTAVEGGIDGPDIPGGVGNGGPRFGDYRTREDEGRSPVRALIVRNGSFGSPPMAGLKWPDGVPRPDLLDCIQVIDHECTAVTPICDPEMIGFSSGNDGDVTITVGSNPCGSASERPVRARDVPDWCKFIFDPESLPSECGGYSDTLNRNWQLFHTLPKFCDVAKVAPDSVGPCNPTSPVILDAIRKQAAGWLPGKPSSRCEALGPGSGGAEHCVNCDAAGTCTETVKRPLVDPTVAIPTVQKNINDDDSSSSGDSLIDVIVTVAKAIGSAISSLFSGKGSTQAPDPKAAASTTPAAPPAAATTAAASSSSNTPSTSATATNTNSSAHPRGPFIPGGDPTDLVSRPTGRVADPVDLADGAYRIVHVDLDFPGPVRSLSLSRLYSSSSRNRSSLGSNWQHSWDERIQPLTQDTTPPWLSPWCAGSDAITTAVLHHKSDGGLDLYLFDAASALFLPHAGSTSTLAKTSVGWALRDPDGRVRTFDADGYLISDADRFGNAFKLAYEHTPLGLLFEWHCSPDRLTARNETLYHRRNALLSYLVGAVPRPDADQSQWRVTDADFSPPHDLIHPDPVIRERLQYARDLLLFLGSGAVLPESSDGFRRKRVTTVTDPIGRQLRFQYALANSWNPATPDPAVFANHPDEGMVQSIQGPCGTKVSYEYQRPIRYPKELNEMFLVRAIREDGLNPPIGLIASAAREYRFEYCWPGHNVDTYQPYRSTVQNLYLRYFQTFVGCGYPDPVSCPGGDMFNLKRFNPGDPKDLARRAMMAYVSDVADKIITVFRNGQIECETRYPVDPNHDQFGKVVSQRFGSTSCAAPLRPSPPDQPSDHWKTTLPKVLLEWVDSGPANLDQYGTPVSERSDAILPRAIRYRYPLEPKPVGTAAPVYAPKPKNPKECDLNAMVEREKDLPGWRPRVAYYDADSPVSRASFVTTLLNAVLSLIGIPRGSTAGAFISDLRRTWLLPEQLISAQVGDPTHNDLLTSPEVDPGNPLLVILRRIVGRRQAIAANANRICRWVKETDRNGVVRWRGVNYRGQILVLAEPDFNGVFRFSEWRYNADGLVVKYRPPSPESNGGVHSYHWVYDEINPASMRGWSQWLPAFWARRQNILRFEHRINGRVPADLESGRPSNGSNPPDFESVAGTYQNITWEPLFNQPLQIEEGVLAADPRWWSRKLYDHSHRRSDFVFDYQELSFQGQDTDPGSIGGLLESLRPWGFAWMRNDANAMAWQFPVALFGKDLNGDGESGNRYANGSAGGVLSPEAIAARRGVGAMVGIVESRPNFAANSRQWLITHSPHGLPARVEGPDGELLLFDYYDIGSPFGAVGQAPQANDANPGFIGMLARRVVRLSRPGWPQNGPAKVPNDALSGPYQFLPIPSLPRNTSRAESHAALAAIALPEEMIEDILDTISEDPAFVPAGAKYISTFTYNAVGHMIEMVHPSGSRRWDTDTDGRIVRSVDEEGVITESDWDIFGNPIGGRTSGSKGLVCEWIARYDEEGRMVFKADAIEPNAFKNPPQGRSLLRSWSFLPEGELAMATDAEGVISSYIYDGWGRVVNEDQGKPGSSDRRTFDRDWDIEDRVTAVIAGGKKRQGLPNATQFWRYDQLGRVTEHEDEHGLLWRFAWSGRGIKTRRAIANRPYGASLNASWEEVTDFDDYLRSTRVTVIGDGPTGSTSRTITEASSWSLNGARLTSSQLGLTQTVFVSDLAGRVVWESRPDSTEIVRSWSEIARRAVVAELRLDQQGRRKCRATITMYDRRGLPINTTVTAAESGQVGPSHRISTDRIFDAMGRLVVEIGPLGERTSFERDWCGRILERRVERTPGGSADVTSMTWDGRGDIKRVVDSSGQELLIGRDDFGTIKETSLSGSRRIDLSIERDRLGRVIFFTDGVFRVRRTWSEGARRGYPVLDELETQKSGWAALTRREFDQLGRLRTIQMTNPAIDWLTERERTVSTRMDYDAIGRLVDETTIIGRNRRVRVQNTFLSIQGGGWERDWKASTGNWMQSGQDLIDGAGRLTRRSNGRSQIKFQWEGASYVGREQPQPGWTSPLTETVDLDAFGLPRRSEVRVVTLNAAGNPQNPAEAALLAPLGSNQTLVGGPLFEQSFDRDQIGRVTSWWWESAHPVSGIVARWRGSRYDHQRRLDMLWEDASFGNRPKIAAYSADAATVAGLAQATSSEWSYTRDVVTGDLIGIQDQQGNQRFSMAAARALGHQITDIDVGGISSVIHYDKAGRIVSISGTPDMEFTWNPTGALGFVRSKGTLLEGYLYDGKGRLITIIDTNQSISQIHAFDGLNIIAGLQSSGRLKWDAVWGANGTDQLLAFFNSVSRDTTVPINDLNGSPLAVWVPSSASLSSLVNWTAEGERIVSTPGGGVTCDETGSWNICGIPATTEFGFAGMWHSKNTGFVWMRARWYSPVLSQFLSPDPAGFQEGTNVYNYASSDPINRRDPLGLGSNGAAGASSPSDATPGIWARSNDDLQRDQISRFLTFEMNPQQAFPSGGLGSALSFLIPFSDPRMTYALGYHVKHDIYAPIADWISDLAGTDRQARLFVGRNGAIREWTGPRDHRDAFGAILEIGSFFLPTEPISFARMTAPGIEASAMARSTSEIFQLLARFRDEEVVATRSIYPEFVVTGPIDPALNLGGANTGTWFGNILNERVRFRVESAINEGLLTPQLQWTRQGQRGVDFWISQGQQSTGFDLMTATERQLMSHEARYLEKATPDGSIMSELFPLLYRR